MTTHFQTTEEGYQGRKWVLVDAQGVPVGRLASKIAMVLRGKHRPNFTPHVDGGDFVVVINAGKVKLTGKKAENKIYYSVSGHIGGLKGVTAGVLLQKQPERIIKEAVEGMLPSGVLSHQLMKKLKIYRDAEHEHVAQNPETLKINN